MINKHIGIKDCWCKNELFYKGNSFFCFCFFEKGGAHAPVAPPPPRYGLGDTMSIFPNCVKNVRIQALI